MVPNFSCWGFPPLPLDTCSSGLLGSQQHPDRTLKIHPNLKFLCLEHPVTVFVASLSESLKAIGVMQVPICFANGRSAVFSMILVPNLP